ncbi:MAG: ATP-binding cassette domain-containing protein [Pseudonocardiaceae bacterium]
MSGGPMSGGAHLKLEQLTLAFGDMLAAEIDLDVQPGEIVILLGPSGCGKSTILRALAGLVAPLGGSAQVDGTPVTEANACAMIFQEDALLPWRSARHNVEYALQLRGVGPRQRRQLAEDLLIQVGLEGLPPTCPASSPEGCANVSSSPELWPPSPGSC